MHFASINDAVYVEPFVGGGAVLFWILQKYSNISQAVINDINPDLINVYRIIKDAPQDLISVLKQYQDSYIYLNDEERKAFYLTKRKIFNHKAVSREEMAALFIFLNRTCFNGLYRVNAKGEFNVPHGKYANPKICDEANILADKSLFYFDPPYKPLTETSSFTSYAKEGFNDDEQKRLGEFCVEISRKHAMFVASNSDPQGVNPKEDFFDKVYSTFSIRKVQATRMINANPNGRGKLSEIMITNISL